MDEKLLQHVWGSILFDFQRLITTEGVPVSLLHQGMHNKDQGPDFKNARVRIGYADFFGDVEIHLNSDIWFEHQHQHDPAYNSVVLHVVLHSTGKPIQRQDGTIIPEISLERRIFHSLEKNYHRLLLADSPIPCEKLISNITPVIWEDWINELGILRVSGKAQKFSLRLKETKNNWEQVLWEELSAIFGGPVNGESFRQLAQQVPLSVIRKFGRSTLQMESLLFGSAGLLDGVNCEDEYYVQLKKEWDFFSEAEIIQKNHLLFRHLRMRPTSFPMIRISQLAGICRVFPALIELLLDPVEILQHRKDISCSPYWKNHNHFGTESISVSGIPGKQWLELLVINTILPLAWLYFHSHGRDKQNDFLPRLEKISPENNKQTRKFHAFGLEIKNALQSQGVLELEKKFCREKNCLNCALGKSILNTT